MLRIVKAEEVKDAGVKKTYSCHVIINNGKYDWKRPIHEQSAGSPEVAAYKAVQKMVKEFRLHHQEKIERISVEIWTGQKGNGK